MSLQMPRLLARWSLIHLTVVVGSSASVPRADARVKKIVVDKKVSPAFDGSRFRRGGAV